MGELSAAAIGIPSFDGPLRRRWGEKLAPHRLTELLADAPRRIGVPDATDRDFWQAADRPTVTRVLELAEAERPAPWPQPRASEYARYFRVGDRRTYESHVAVRRARLARAVVAATATDDTDWLDEAGDGIALLLEQATWCWPAHDDTFQRRGRVVPSREAPFLDLGAAEVVSELAWADHVLGPRLDERIPGLRDWIRAEARDRVFLPFLTRRDWHWLGLDGNAHNWTAWVQGHVLTAALLLVEDPEDRAELVARALDGLDRYLATLPPDGAPDEGFAYWWNGVARLLEALDVLRTVTGGELDATGIPALAATVQFPHRMHLGGPWYVNVADGPARLVGEWQPWHVPFRWARRLGDAEAERHARSYRSPDGPVAGLDGALGRMLAALTDEDWVRAETATPPLIPRSWLPSIQLFLTRDKPGTEGGLVLAVKGGHNGEHHNHKDVGSFIVAADGEPVLVDAGKTTYDAQTFGPHRYEIRAMRSEWHSAPAPWGLEQGAGPEFAAQVLRVADNGVELELAAAYGLPETESWRRRAELAAGEVRVRDAWSLTDRGDHHDRAAGDSGSGSGSGRSTGELTADSEPTAIHYLTRDGAALSGPATVTVPTPTGGTVELSWDRDDLDVTIEEWTLDDPSLADVWGERLARVTVRVPSDREDGRRTGAVTATITIR